jgi:hypothetical protein
MFAHDSINPSWISKCADYLVSIFGANSLKGATVLDYAFGRGNWSLAFIEAGATKVVAIDASSSNVTRFTQYCTSHKIKNIDIRIGNALEASIDGVFDVVWLYGILHHIKKPLFFMKRMALNLASDSAKMLVYSYNSNCLRHRLVTAARKGIIYENSADFEADALLFNPLARLRARDDLCAPWIKWHSHMQMTELLTDTGLVEERSVIGFLDFLGKTESPEFTPHHIICRRASAIMTPMPYSGKCEQGDFDHSIIGDLADWIVDQIDAEGRKFSIGLFNTHFSALRHCGYSKTIEEDFQFLLYSWRKNNLPMPDDPLLKIYLEAGINSTIGRDIVFPNNFLHQSKLAKFIKNNVIRL